MDINKFLDEYGFLSNYLRVVNDSCYKKLSLEEKKELLLKLIDTNYQRRNADVIKRLEGRGSFLLANNFEDKPFMKDISRGSKINKKDFNGVSLNSLVQCETLEDIKTLGLLPDKNTESGMKKLKQMLLSIRLEIEEYKLLELEEGEDTCSLEIEKLENLFEILSDYISYEDSEDIKIEVQNDFSVFYLPNNLSFNDDNNSSPLVKDVSKNKRQDVLISMIDSIKSQEFKGLKRFGNHLSDFYELRNGQQRVVFNFLTPNICFIVFAFTKKADNEKRYRMELCNRINRYRRMKTQLKKALKNEDFINKQIEIDDLIYQVINSKEKELVKAGDNNE